MFQTSCDVGNNRLGRLLNAQKHLFGDIPSDRLHHKHGRGDIHHSVKHRFVYSILLDELRTLCQTRFLCKLLQSLYIYVLHSVNRIQIRGVRLGTLIQSFSVIVSRCGDSKSRN